MQRIGLQGARVIVAVECRFHGSFADDNHPKTPVDQAGLAAIRVRSGKQLGVYIMYQGLVGDRLADGKKADTVGRRLVGENRLSSRRADYRHVEGILGAH